jgi:hypothetical protein
MRERLNSNPLLQMAVIGVLLVGGGFFVLSTMGGGGEGGSAPSPSSVETVTVATGEEPAPSPSSPAPAPGTAPSSLGATQPLPRPVIEAWNADQTVALLFVHNGGIDDALLTVASARLAALPGVATFVVPADRISHYAAITQGVGVDRVPALVVLRPKRLDQGIPTASVSYGFQSGESVVQAVLDAGYTGPTLDYHP